MIKVGVIGVGSFGSKRAKTIKETLNGELVAIADIDKKRAEKMSVDLNVKCYYSADELLAVQEIEAVIISVPNKFHMPLAIKALESGKHVLVEKPLARTTEEAEKMVETAKRTGKFLKTGSNHRYFSSIKRANEIIKRGDIGDIVSFNGRIGNDGKRIKNTWYWDKDISGGGAMLDSSCHLLDIARWFMGDFDEAVGITTNLYWKDCPVEDTGTGIFLGKKGKTAIINSSRHQLAGYLYFEINGTDGYLVVDGRFDANGEDSLCWKSNKGDGKIQSIDYSQLKQNSYKDELEDFFNCIQIGLQPQASGQDGLEAIKMVEAVYNSDGNKIII